METVTLLVLLMISGGGLSLRFLAQTDSCDRRNSVTAGFRREVDGILGRTVHYPS
jgi:hypothetical protein